MPNTLKPVNPVGAFPSSLQVYDGSPYRRYAPSAYDSSMSVYEELVMIREYLNQMINNFNDLHQYVGENILFMYKTINEMIEEIESFEGHIMDVVLPENIAKILNEWYENGKLGQIINDEVFGMKADKKNVERLESFVFGWDNIIINKDLVENGDWTKAIQKTIDNLKKDGTMFIPKGEYLIDAEVGVKAKDDMNIIIEKGAILKAKPNGATDYRILELLHVKNVNINGGHLKGERNEHTGSAGEWGYGLRIRGCKNVYVEKMLATDCWGDGFYVGKVFESDEIHNDNVVLKDCIADNNRRNGFSVTDGYKGGVKLINPISTNTNGIAPQSGIDLEPEGANCLYENIVVENPTTRGNKGFGINLQLSLLANRGLISTVTVDNHNDEGSQGGLGLWGNNANIGGSVTFNNPSWNNNKSNGFSSSAWDITSSNVVLMNPKVINCNSNPYSSDQFGSAFAIYRNSDALSSYDFGNITIINPIAVDNRVVKTMRYCFFISDLKNNTPKTIKDINIIDPIALKGYTGDMNLFRCIGKYSDSLMTTLRSDKYPTATIGYANYRRFITNKPADDYTTYTLGDLDYGMPPVTIMSENPQKITIKPPLGGKIVPGYGVDEAIYTQVVGTSITLEPLGDKTWKITNQVGSWLKVGS